MQAINASRKVYSVRIKKKDHRKQANQVLNVYPNPASDYVVFEYNMPDAMNKLVLSITDVSGREIKRLDCDGSVGKTQWSTGSIQPGVYIYKLMDGRSTVNTGRIVITK